ncbi:MAG: acyltransferase [Caulobacterales bacterium]|nr:acyltransferase [Caulobacterales bacterium]
MAWTAISTRDGATPIARGGWLDALRFIVASLIILHHFQASGPRPLAEAVHPMFELSGFLLTNFFLMDSGYVLMRVYGEQVRLGRLSPGEFVLKRVLRVVPAHLIVLSGLIGLVLAVGVLGASPTHPEWFAWDQLPAQALLVQAFGVHGGLGWNAPTWSISALIGCYLAFPWIVRTLSRADPWTALAWGVGVYLLANQTTWLLLDHPVWQMPMRYGFFRALALFFLGMCLARFAAAAWIDPRLARWTLALSALAFFALQFAGKFGLASIGVIALIVLAAGAVPVTRPSKWVQTAAVVSFAMFVSNEVVRIGWFGAVDVAAAKLDLSEPVRWALWGLGLAAAVGFAFAFHFLIDEPIQSRLRRWLKGRRDPVVADSAPAAPRQV